MSNRTLKQMTQIRQPKFGHYAGEFLTHGIGHIVVKSLHLNAINSIIFKKRN